MSQRTKELFDQMISAEPMDRLRAGVLERVKRAETADHKRRLTIYALLTSGAFVAIMSL